MRETPRSEQFDDVYFSADDGPGETAHVFLVGNNLPGAWQGRDRFIIGETGFGTGLNFLLAWELFDRTAEKGAFLDFVSVEKFPLSVEEIRKGLAPWAARLSPYLDKMLEQYPIRVPGFHRIVFDGRVALTLIFGDANDVLPEVEASVDAWFLDGFTPAKNPDMWTDKVFGEMARLSHAGTTFSTFTSAGFVKRGLQAAGFSVEKKKGFGRKRDMLAGVCEKGSTKPVMKKEKNIPIAGAGLAGCTAAWVLKQYGFEPVLYDPNGIASGASGNPIGIINPRFTAFRDAQSDFYTAAFAQTVRSFSQLKGVDYHHCGSMHLVTDEEKEKRFSRTAENWGWDTAHMQYLSAGEASEIAGTQLGKGALYLPDSAQVNPKALCEAYAKDIPFVQGACDNPAVIATAIVEGVPVHTVRGQITFVKANEVSREIKTNICYGGYMSAAINGQHVVGSTFQKWLSDSIIRPEDDADNLAKMRENIPGVGVLEIIGQRAALRSAAQDRFPIVGEKGGQLYSIAHGSHGIGTTLGAAHLLADYLRGGPFSLGRLSMEALSPERFSVRAAKKAVAI